MARVSDPTAPYAVRTWTEVGVALGISRTLAYRTGMTAIAKLRAVARDEDDLRALLAALDARRVIAHPAVALDAPHELTDYAL